MRRETQNLLLLLLGGALVKLTWTGDYLRYVKPALWPWLLGTGSVLVTLALVAIVADIRASGSGAAGHATRLDRSPTGQHTAGEGSASRSPWLLVLPVLAIYLVAPPALGADSVERDGGNDSVARAPSARFDSLPAHPAPLLSVSEFTTRAIWGEGTELRDRVVRLRGFVVHPDEHRTQLVRMRINCCAADATALRVELGRRPPPAAESPPADTWIEVAGTLRPGTATESNGYVPVLDVRALHPIPTPAEPYED